MSRLMTPSNLAEPSVLQEDASRKRREEEEKKRKRRQQVEAQAGRKLTDAEFDQIWQRESQLGGAAPAQQDPSITQPEPMQAGRQQQPMLQEVPGGGGVTRVPGSDPGPADPRGRILEKLQEQVQAGRLSNEDYVKSVRELTGYQGPGTDQPRQPQSIYQLDQEGYVTGGEDAPSYERATRHKPVDDPQAKLISQNLQRIMRRAPRRGRYSISKEQYQQEMKLLYDSHEEFEDVRKMLNDSYDRMDSVAKAQFNELQKSSHALSTARKDGRINMLEYYRGMDTLHDLAQQYRWKSHFTAPGGQVGDIVDDGQVIKQRTKDGGWDVLGLNRDYAEANAIISGNKKLIPNAKGDYIEVDLDTGIEVDKLRDMTDEAQEEIAVQARYAMNAWEENLIPQRDVMGNIQGFIDRTTGAELTPQEIKEKGNIAYWMQQGEEQWLQSRTRTQSIVRQLYGGTTTQAEELKQGQQHQQSQQQQQQRMAQNPGVQIDQALQQGGGTALDRQQRQEELSEVQQFIQQQQQQEAAGGGWAGSPQQPQQQTPPPQQRRGFAPQEATQTPRQQGRRQGRRSVGEFKNTLSAEIRGNPEMNEMLQQLDQLGRGKATPEKREQARQLARRIIALRDELRKQQAAMRSQ